jgi:predicted phosphodiesterase
MVYAVISDIHSDIHALNSVLNRINTMQFDKIVCLGDIVGYGENAEEVVQEILKQNITCVCGNHEKALFNEEAFEFMNDKAKKAININHDQLSDTSLDYLSLLPNYLVENNIRFVHGVPPDSVFDYLSHTEKEEIVKLSKKYSETITFCGHTHLNEIVEIDEKKVNRNKNIQFDQNYNLNKSNRYIINVGSISQPRQSDVSEKVFVLYDSASSQLRFIKSE